MFVTHYTEFKCPYCSHEYKKIVGSGENYEYKGDIYSYNICPNCDEEYLRRNGEPFKMPEDRSELIFHSRWMS